MLETSPDRSREVPDTSCSSVADGSLQTGCPLLLRNCAGTLRSAADSRFSFTVLLLMLVAPKAYHLGLQTREYDLDKQQVCHLRRHPTLVNELDMLIFVALEQQLHVSSCEQIAQAILAGTQGRLNPIQCVPLWNIPLEMSTSQKLDMQLSFLSDLVQ